MIERPHAGFEQSARFARDIGFARGIVADQDHRQSGNEPVRGGQPPRLGRDLGAQIGGDGFAVDDFRAHSVPVSRPSSATPSGICVQRRNDTPEVIALNRR